MVHDKRSVLGKKVHNHWFS